MENKFDYRKICFIHYNYSLKIFEFKNVSSYVVCWLRFFCKTFGYLLKSPHTFKKVDEVLVVIPSANNQRSTKPILDAMRHKNYTCVERFYNFLPMASVYIRSMFHSSGFRKLYNSSTNEERNMIRARFDDFAAAEALYTVVGKFYDRNPQIKLLIVSNDHYPIMRSFIEQARIHGVKTLYSQHASVSEYFPPLEFDYSFLDGLESFKKYQSIGKIEGKAFLVGSPRFDVITQLERQNSNLIGIAFNKLDDNEKILSLILKMKENGFNNIVVRPHPQQDKNNQDWSMFTRVGCEISHPLQENPFEFISRLSFLIAGASSIHLEAALLRIPSVIYNMQTGVNHLDYYGYAKMGLTPMALDSDCVISLIKSPHIPSVDTIRYYDAAFGTDYDGKSASLAARFIDSFLEGNEEEVLTTLFVKSSENYYVIK